MLKKMHKISIVPLFKMHNDLKIDDENFTMRYKICFLRFMEPVDLFKI
jgi:hypothetical protein